MMPSPTQSPSRARLLFGAVTALALASSASAVEIFSVTATFAEPNGFALGEFSARLAVCSGPDFASLSIPMMTWDTNVPTSANHNAFRCPRGAKEAHSRIFNHAKLNAKRHSICKNHGR